MPTKTPVIGSQLYRNATLSRRFFGPHPSGGSEAFAVHEG